MILIVDDEYWARKSLKRLCEDVIGENEIKEFDNCHDVIEFVRENKVNIAIIDVLLPDYSGFYVGQNLKKIDPDISIIYLSAVEGFGKVFKRNGGDYFLLKPVTEADLKKAFNIN